MSQLRAQYTAPKCQVTPSGVRGPTDRDLVPQGRHRRGELDGFAIPAGMLLLALMGRLSLPRRRPHVRPLRTN